MTVSHWRRTERLGLLETEAAVVGGGISGVSAALHLQDAGVPCVLIERHELGSGASGRNAGFLMRGAADNYFLASRQHGRETARLLWRWTEENIAMLRARGIERVPSFARRPSALLAIEPTELDELRRSAEMLREDGFEAGWIDRHDDAAWRTGKALGALLNPCDACVNPVDALRHLAASLTCRVLEHQEFAELRRGGAHIELRLTDCIVRCRKVIFCLNAYAALVWPEFRALIEPNRGQMLALSAPESVLPLSYCYYANRGSEYFRRADGNTVVLGGRRTADTQAERTWDDRTTGLIQRELERFGEHLFGFLPPVVARWSGVMGFTPDHLPLIGPLPDHAGAVWFCGGYTGHGASLAHRCTKAAVDAMLQGTMAPFPLTRVQGKPTRQTTE